MTLTEEFWLNSYIIAKKVFCISLASYFSRVYSLFKKKSVFLHLDCEDRRLVCHFSGKPSTTRLSKAKYLKFLLCEIFDFSPCGRRPLVHFVQNDNFIE